MGIEQKNDYTHMYVQSYICVCVCVCVMSLSRVQLFPSGSSVHGMLLARILE